MEYHTQHFMRGEWYGYRFPETISELRDEIMDARDYEIEEKRKLFYKYRDFFKPWDVRVWTETEGNRSNYWLNAVSFSSREARDNFLIHTNNVGIMTRRYGSFFQHYPCIFSVKTSIKV